MKLCFKNLIQKYSHLITKKKKKKFIQKIKMEEKIHHENDIENRKRIRV